MKTRRSVTRIPAHQRVVRITISLKPAIYDAGKELVRRGAYGGLGDYVADRIRRDAGLDVVRLAPTIPDAV